MNPLVLLGAALPVGAAYLLLQPARRAGMSRTCATALAIGAGLGIASCTFFLALVLFDGQRAGVIGVDAVLMAVALVVWRRAGTVAAQQPAPLSSSERVLAIALCIAAAAAATSFLANTLEDPHGRWDAWATWNLRARWLADAGPAWRTAFAKPTGHGDYPLLLPDTVARLWVYGGTRDVIVPAAVAAAYGAALVLLLYAGLAALRGRAQGLIGALCLLGTPVFLRILPWQYADVPLAFNLLAVVTLLALADRHPAGERPMLVWAGVAAGLMAWTKNEGMVLAFGIVVARGGLMLVRRTPPLRSAGWFFAGLLPPTAILLYFKLTLAPLSSQFGQTLENVMRLLVDAGRYGAILRAAAYELARGIGPVLLALGIYAVLLGRTRDQRARSEAAGVVPILAFAALAYGFTYLITRADLTWILRYSLDRLVLQLWPTTLLATLLYVSSPTEHDAAAAQLASAVRLPAKPASRRQRRAGRR
ncbi:MAG: hypothetical protein ABI629_12775 [bacterium]